MQLILLKYSMCGEFRTIADRLGSFSPGVGGHLSHCVRQYIGDIQSVSHCSIFNIPHPVRYNKIYYFTIICIARCVLPYRLAYVVPVSHARIVSSIYIYIYIEHVSQTRIAQGVQDSHALQM